jgi:predicted kinase
VPFDCIEFDPRLRWIDVLSDLAFLVMDLMSRGAEALAALLLSAYLESTGDYDGVRLLPFYAVYRALVRAKVDAIAAAQSAGRSAHYEERLRDRVRAALEWIDRRRPTLVLMHGLSGSGKSWLSERLVPAFPALRIRSDLERKRLTSTAAGPASWRQGIYAPEVSHRTYARLVECAESCLQAGFNVVVDAASLDPADRELVRGISTRLQTGFRIVSCQADTATLFERLRDRAREGKDPSDADVAVLQAQLRGVRPFTAAEEGHVITADTRERDVVERVVDALRPSRA